MSFCSFFLCKVCRMYVWLHENNKGYKYVEISLNKYLTLFKRPNKVMVRLWNVTFNDKSMDIYQINPPASPLSPFPSIFFKCGKTGCFVTIKDFSDKRASSRTSVVTRMKHSFTLDQSPLFYVSFILFPYIFHLGINVQINLEFIFC